jgi:alpha-beta hydrolase superfamily lysophospholipase
MTRSKTFQFRSRGKLLFAQKWWPKDYPRAVVIFVHSWAEHSGRYADISAHLTQQGYATYGFDFEGHGQSDGHRGNIPNFQQWVTDVNAFVSAVQSELRSVPIFLCSFGMGGCAVAYYVTAEHHDIEGVIFAASGLVVSKKLSKFKILMSWLLGGLLPKWPISLLPPNQMSSVFVQQRDYDEDPLVYHGYMNAGTAKELLLANLHIGKKLASIDVPLLVLHGAEDALVAPEGGTALYTQAASLDKTLHLYPNILHDVFHESNRLEVFEHVRTWLDARTKEQW